MEELVLKDEMATEALYLLNKLEKMTPGSEEHSRVVEDIVKIAKTCNDCFKIESDSNNESSRIENEKERNERELDIKQLQIELENRKLTRIKADNAFSAGLFTVLFAAGLVYEAKGHIVPVKFSKLMDFIPKAIKL